MRRRYVIAGIAAAALLTAGYGSVRYYRRGRKSPGRTRNPLLDRFMPLFDVRERHEIEVLAPAATTWASARAIDPNRSRLVRGIFQARQLFMGGTAPPPRPAATFLDEVLALGWRVLAEVPGEGMVLGAVTEPWRADVTFRGISPEAFAAFDEPGWVKIVWTIEVVQLDDERSLFCTETRSVATDAGSRVRFRRYWSLVRPGVLLIRREMLRLVKREAEAGARLSGGRQTTGPRVEPDHPVPSAT